MSDWREVAIERVERPTTRVVSIFIPNVIGTYEAGQHVDVRLTAPDGYQAQRSYSIASAPGAPLLELVIEALEGGEVSPYFHEVAQAGDTFEVRGPIGGHFVWRPSDGGPVLLIGGGSGVVPLLSIARHRALASPDTPMMLVYSARTWDEVIQRDELVKMDGGRFRLMLAITRGRKVRPNDLEGRLDAVSFKALAPGTFVRAYVCGSNSFCEAAAAGLLDAGMAPGLVRVERYGG